MIWLQFVYLLKLQPLNQMWHLFLLWILPLLLVHIFPTNFLKIYNLSRVPSHLHCWNINILETLIFLTVNSSTSNTCFLSMLSLWFSPNPGSTNKKGDSDTQKHQGIDELLTQIFLIMTKQPKLQQESFGSFQLPWKGNIHLPLN